MALSDYLTGEDAKKIKVVQKIDTSKLKAANPSSELNRTDREKESVASPSSLSLPKTTTKEIPTYKSNIVSSGVQNSLLSMPEMNNTLEFKGHNYVADQPIRNALKRIDNAGTSILNSMPAQFGVIEDAFKQTVKGNNNTKAIEKQMTMQKNAVDRMNYLSNYKHRGNKEALLNDPEYQEALKLYNSASRVINAYNNKPMDINSDVMQAYGDALALRNKATEGLSPTGQFLGNTAIGIGETLSTLPLAVANPSLPLAMAAARGTANKIYDVGNQGKSASEALSRGVASGAVEAATEKIGLDKALDIIKSPATKGLKSVATNMLKQGAAEGLEEGASYIGNYAVDKTFDKNTQFDAKELGASMLGGLLSGGAIGGVSSGISGLKSMASENPKYYFIDYADDNSKKMVSQNIHDDMVKRGKVVKIEDSDIEKFNDYYPDLRHLKKKERNPILKSKTTEIKNVIKEFLEKDFKGKNIEFKINGDTIEAKLYDTGIKEVLEKLTKEKAAMLGKTADIFSNAEYLYTTNDKTNNTNVERWNYFYVPISIDDNIVGVRIAIRDITMPKESQIYNWGIKKETPVGSGDKRANARHESNPHSDVSLNNIINYVDKNSNGKSSNLPGTLPNNSTNTETSSFKKNTVGAAENNPNSTRQKLDELAEKYGVLPQGENATRIANLPKQIDDSNKRVNKYAGTMIEAENIPDDLVGRIEEGIAEGRYSHDLITDADAIQKAESTISKDGGKTALIEWDSAVKKGTFDKYDLALGQKLLIEASNMGDIKTSDKIASELAQAFSIAGQNLQAARLLKRLTPEGMVAYAELELAKIRNELALNGKAKKQIDNVSLTENDIQDIKLLMEEAETMPDGREKDVKIAQVKSIIENKIPPTDGDKLRTLARISMLFNLKTMDRNILGNILVAPQSIASDIVGSLIDRQAAKKTGTRTTALPQASALSGLSKGIKEATQDYKLGINTRDIEGNRFNISNSKTFDDNKKIGKALNKIDNTVSFLLDVGDRPFYETWYENSLKQQMKANNVSEPTDAMREVARQEALKRTWQDNNNYTKAMTGIRNILNKTIHIKGYGLGDMVIPFAKTPANLTKALVDYSPVGVVNAIKSKSRALTRAIETGEGVELAQREFVDTLSKGITGTLLMLVLAAAKEKGLISGKANEDKDVAQFEKEIMGIMPYSVKVGNKSYTYDWALPLGGTAAMVSDSIDAYKDAKESKQGGEAFNALISALSAAGKVVFNQSFSRGISQLFSNDDPVSGAIDIMLNEPAKFTPTLLSQIAQAIDGNARTTYVYGNELATALNTLKSKIPGLRETLPLATNTLGDPKQFNESVFDVFVNPSNYSTDISTEATDWMYDIYKDTGNKSVLPPVAPNYIDYKKERYPFTPQEKEGYQQLTGSIINDGVETLLNSPFADINGEDAEKFISALHDYAREKGKMEYIPGYVPSTKTTEKIDALKEMGLTTGEAIALKYLISSADNKEEANKFIMSLDYDADTKTILSNFFSNNITIIPGEAPDFTDKESFAESTSTPKSRGWETIQKNKSFSNMTEDQYDKAYNIISISEKGKTKEDKIKELTNYFSITYGYTGGTARTQASKFWNTIK